MSEFTPQDRERAQKTLTLLEGHIKLSDERHEESKKITLDHEKRLRKNEGMIAKVSVVTGFISAGITAGVVTVVRKFSG